MRRACHNILYTVVNSDAASYTYRYVFPAWKGILLAADALIVLAVVVGLVRGRNKQKARAAGHQDG